MFKRKIIFILLIFSLIINLCIQNITVFGEGNKTESGKTSAISYFISGYVASETPQISLQKSNFMVEVEGTSLYSIPDEKGYFRIEGDLESIKNCNLKISRPGYLIRKINVTNLTSSIQIGSEFKPIVLWKGDFPVKGTSDDAINMVDIMQLAVLFNKIEGEPGYLDLFDLNGDSSINMADVMIIAKHFNTSSESYTNDVLVMKSAPIGWRNLCDIELFKDKQTIPGPSGNGELETENGNIPIDNLNSYQGLPSLRFNITKSVTTWAVAVIPAGGWSSIDLSQYVPNGFLEFNLKGASGGEQFTISAIDRVFERASGVNCQVTLNIQDYVNVTDRWQHVRIPLSKLIDASKGISAKSILQININNSIANPMTVWFNDIKITSTDKEKGFPAIKVNQIGYLPTASKAALVTGFEDELKAYDGMEFQVIRKVDNMSIFRGKLELLKDYDAIDSGERMFKADFTKLTDPGEYYISINGIEKSLNFKIGKDIFKSLLNDTIRYYYYQRQGIELVSPYCKDFPRKDYTPKDNHARFVSNSKDPIDASMGWYDAGDKGKYVNNAASSISYLFWAYEMCPNQFEDNQLNIPESGNGTPDILDEVRWELEWMLKMQDKESGGFYARIQGDKLDDLTFTERTIKDIEGDRVNIRPTDDTACAAAVLAQASILYASFDPIFSKKCLDSAIKAWEYLLENPSNIPSPSGPYNVTNDSADRLWAAANLFRASGKETYHDYFKKNYTKFKYNFEANACDGDTWGFMWLTAFECYLKAEDKDPLVVNWIKNEFTQWLNTIKKQYQSNPWQIFSKEGNYYWGNMMSITNVPNKAYIGAKLLGIDDPSLKVLLMDSMNWILGTNPLRRSFVSGYGEDCVKNIFSTIYSIDEKPGIPKGYVPAGPNCFEGKGLSRFAAKCHNDSDTNYYTNEHCIIFQGSVVQATTFLNEFGDKEMVKK